MSNKYPGGIITSGANAGYSVFFDGTGDYLSMSSGTSLGAGNFTIECWVYLTAAAASETTVGSSTNYYTVGFNGNFVFRVGTTNLWRSFDGQGSQATIDGSFTWSTGQWYHMAWVRNSGTVTVYRNGTSLGSVADSKTLSDSTNGYGIAATRQASSYSSLLTGYISNLRVVVGTALYTAAFTPPTQLFNVSGTSLLTCNSPAIVDQSSNNFTITANGNAAVSTFTPFQGYVAYNPALGAATPGIWSVSDAIQAAQTRRWNMYDPYFNYTTLLLHGNGTNGAQNNTFLDSSSNNFTITRNGNTTQGTFSPFSQTGWSNYFGATGNYLSIPYSSSFNLTGDFTVECWINPGNLPSSTGVAPQAYERIFSFGTFNAANSFGFEINSNDPSTVRKFVAWYNGTSYALSSNNAVSPGNWYHVALVRSGTTITFYLNGVSTGTITGASAAINTSQAFYIATLHAYESDSAAAFNGYISNFRLVKGTAVYTSNFTPSTTPLTAITNTVLLTCQSNRFIDNSSSPATITINGTPSVQAFSPFYPVVAYTPQAQGGSGYFDGTTDFLTAPADAKWRFGSGDFTIEAYVYIGSGTSYNLAFHWNGTSSGTVTGTTAVRANSWNHVAVTRTGTTLNFWINGVGDASNPLTVSSTIYNNTDLLAIGKGADHTAGAGMDICHCGETGGVSNKWFFYLANSTVGSFVGFMSWFRISSSVRYTANFTPPSAPTTSDANTSLLLNFTNAGIVDSTAKNVLETVSGAQISTAQSKFGGSSLLFNGSSDYLVSTAANTRNLVNFGTGDFTVECWVYFNGTGTNQGFLDSATSTSSGTSGQWFFNRTSAGNLQYGQHGVGAIISAAWSVSTGVWYHIAICRSSGQSRLFANGVQLGSTTSDTVNYNNAGSLQVGVNATPYWMNGYIDEIRISRYARYTGNFTPQTSQWQDQ